MDLSPFAAQLFAALFERRTGQQLGEARRWRLDVSLTPVLRAHGFADAEQLAMCLAQADDAGHEEVRQAVVDALLNHETSFFRDRATFVMLRDRLLPALAESRQATRRLRIWSAGCSTGQEPHSIAMLLAGAGAAWQGWRIEIVGTDVSPTAIRTARAGCYSQFEVQRGLAITELLGHFTPDGEAWRLNADIAARTRFSAQTLLGPPPAGPFDLILCRNVLLYFADGCKHAIFARFAEVLAPDGALVLGAGETVLGQTDAFHADPAHRGCYRPAQGAGVGVVTRSMPAAA